MYFCDLIEMSVCTLQCELFFFKQTRYVFFSETKHSGKEGIGGDNHTNVETWVLRDDAGLALFGLSIRECSHRQREVQYR